MPKKSETGGVKRAAPVVACIELKITFDVERMSEERQRRIWEGIGIAVGAGMTPKQRAKFLAELEQRVRAL